MDRASILGEYEQASRRQKECCQFAREFMNADLPLLAESYQKEARDLGVIIIDCVEKLEALDEAEGIVKPYKRKSS